MELAIHQEEMSQKPGLVAISDCLLQEWLSVLRRWRMFRQLIFDLLYVAATFLDPIDTNYYLPLNKAKKWIVSETLKWCDLPSETGQIEEQPVEDKEPPKKHFKHLATVIGRKYFLAASAAGTNSKIWGGELRYQAEQQREFCIPVFCSFKTKKPIYNEVRWFASLCEERVSTWLITMLCINLYFLK